MPDYLPDYPVLLKQLSLESLAQQAQQLKPFWLGAQWLLLVKHLASERFQTLPDCLPANQFSTGIVKSEAQTLG